MPFKIVFAPNREGWSTRLRGKPEIPCKPPTGEEAQREHDVLKSQNLSNLWPRNPPDEPRVVATPESPPCLPFASAARHRE